MVGEREIGKGDGARHPRRPSHCAPKGRERLSPRTQVLVRRQHLRDRLVAPRPGLSEKSAAARPSGVDSAPRAAVPHSGGVRMHRRYVFARPLPRIRERRRRPTPRRQGGSEVRVDGTHRVGSFRRPSSPPGDSFPRIQWENAVSVRLPRPPGSINYALGHSRLRTQSGGATERRPTSAGRDSKSDLEAPRSCKTKS
jgi:hypothetical protein